MPQRHKPPILTGARIRKGATVGKGQKRSSLPVKEVLVRGKKLFKGIIKNFNKESHDPRYSPTDLVLQGQKAWQAFHKAGLPVPEISKVDLRKNSPHYLHLFAEDLRKKHGKLYDCHTVGRPTFFSNFSFPKDKTLIENLANDLATIHSIGFFPGNVDFWNFYKKGNTWGRVIIDFDNFKRRGKIQHTNKAIENISDIANYLGPRSKAFKLFIGNYSKTCKNKHLSMLVRRQYAEDRFEHSNSRIID
jgi:hypothetical protein